MTNLAKLKVSLTKHNAHKVARLLKEWPADEVFSKLDDVHAEKAQARKNLSTLSGDTLPPVWGKAQALGPSAIDGLVLVAIIFSHHELIDAMVNASSRDGFSGRIQRDKQLSGKAYTNFVRIIDQLEYASTLDNRGVTFNLRGMFEIPGLGPLVGELLELKLSAVGWNQSNTISAEAARLGFNKVFGISSDELVEWLTKGMQPAAAVSSLSAKDDEFFQEETEGSASNPFIFTPGHNERDVEPLSKSASSKSKANRLHNDIQNRLYAHLKTELGAKSVGTEVNTGSGTAVDLVTQKGGITTFYEIKTGASVRASIRQAIPQLLEYAYWPSVTRADRLVIVSHLPITKSAANYLKFLQEEFDLPLAYQQFDLSKNILI